MTVNEIYIRMIVAYLSKRGPGETVVELLRGGATAENMRLAGVDFDATFGPDHFIRIPKYPNVVVELSEKDDTVPKVLNKVHTALIASAVPDHLVGAFTSTAMAGDFYHTIRVISEWVTLK